MAVEDVAPLQGYQPEIGLLAAIDGPMSMRPSPTAQDARLSSPLAATYAHLGPSKYLRHQFDRLWNEQMGAFALSALGRRVKWEHTLTTNWRSCSTSQRPSGSSRNVRPHARVELAALPPIGTIETRRAASQNLRRGHQRHVPP